MFTAKPASLATLPDLVFLTEKGTVKRSLAADYDVRSKKYATVSLREKDGLLGILFASNGEDLLLVSRDGMSIRFPVDDIPVQGRIAGGVKGMTLEPGDQVSVFGKIGPEDEVTVFSERGWGKKIPQMDFEQQHRGGKGLRAFFFNRNGSNGRYIAGLCIAPSNRPYDLLVRQVHTPETILSGSEVLLQGRAGKGMPYVMAIMDDTVTDVDYEFKPIDPEV